MQEWFVELAYGEETSIGSVKVKNLGTRSNRAVLGVSAPPEMKVLRHEHLLEKDVVAEIEERHEGS